MPHLKVQTSFNIDLQFETSPFHLRLFAWIIDWIFIYAYVILINYIFNKSIGSMNAQSLGFSEVFISIPILIYHLVCELLLNGQSIGKKLMAIKVVAINGKNANASQYLIRWLMRTVDFGFVLGLYLLVMQQFFLGVLFIIISLASFIHFIGSTYNQRLGDLIAGTTVVVKKLPYSLKDTLFQELDINEYQVTFSQVMKLSDKDINIIDNVVKEHRKSKIDKHLETIANKIKSALNIDSDLENEEFLLTLLKDYNFLSRKL